MRYPEKELKASLVEHRLRLQPQLPSLASSLLFPLTLASPTVPASPGLFLISAIRSLLSLCLVQGQEGNLSSPQLCFFFNQTPRIQ